MGATAEDVLRQANSRNPYYRTEGDNRSTQQMNADWIQRQMQNDPAYNPSLRNPNNRQYFLHQDEITNELRELATYEHPALSAKRYADDYYKTPAFVKQAKQYSDALQVLKDMLSGKRPLSLADAYFTVENAWGNTYLSEKQFKATIQQSVDFITTWIAQHGMDVHNNEDVHLAIQKFMSERTSVTVTRGTKDKGQRVETMTHAPFFYDYDDNGGEKDFRNFFVTKCFATGSGQCSGLPAVYLCLAEGLGVQAYLTTAPNHSFVKYLDNSGKPYFFPYTQLSDKPI
jgi:hypothetical protein